MPFYSIGINLIIIYIIYNDSDVSVTCRKPLTKVRLFYCMIQKVLTLYFRRHWRTFCGLSREEFVTCATATLSMLGYEYSLAEIDTSGAEKLMLGAGDESVRITVESPISFTIDVVTAKSNPLTAYALKFFSTEEMREEMTAGACIVDFKNIDADSRPAIAAFVTDLVEEIPRPPWKLTHHVGFRLAVILRLKVRMFWKYWLKYDAEHEGNPKTG